MGTGENLRIPRFCDSQRALAIGLSGESLWKFHSKLLVLENNAGAGR